MRGVLFEGEFRRCSIRAGCGRGGFFIPLLLSLSVEEGFLAG